MLVTHGDIASRCQTYTRPLFDREKIGLRVELADKIIESTRRRDGAAYLAQHVCTGRLACGVGKLPLPPLCTQPPLSS